MLPFLVSTAGLRRIKRYMVLRMTRYATLTAILMIFIHNQMEKLLTKLILIRWFLDLQFWPFSCICSSVGHCLALLGLMTMSVYICANNFETGANTWSRTWLLHQYLHSILSVLGRLMSNCLCTFIGDRLWQGLWQLDGQLYIYIFVLLSPEHIAFKCDIVELWQHIIGIALFYDNNSSPL